MPDTSRAARYILKDYVNARLLYCHPPPGVASDDFMAGSRARTLRRIREAEAAGKKRAPATRVAKGADTFVASPQAVLEAVAETRERQATSKSIRSTAASAPGRSAAATSRALDGSFFTEVGPSARPVAKGVVGAGLGGYSRTVMYPHTQAIGSDGLPIADAGMRRIDAVAGRDQSKRHFKNKEGKKRSGRGYD
jgi:large subunit GTPase 1